MCTVSIVPRAYGFRVACNRDERRGRPIAEPPARRDAGRRTATWPRDPESGGTWIGVNDAGLVAAVLNRNSGGFRLQRSTEPVAGVAPRRSRGTIVPVVLGEARLGDALEVACGLPAGDFAPFTLVLIQAGAVAVVSPRNGRMHARAAVLRRPLVLTSSSLGDHRVVRPRRALFARLLSRHADPVHAQAALHRHRWTTHPELSVVMSRADASTVSRTVVDVNASGIRMRYQPLAL